MITIFKSITDTGAPFVRSVEVALNRIRLGNSKELVERYRLTKDSSLKKKLVGVCFGGEFTHRSAKGLLNHSGLIILDFDKFETNEDAIKFKKELVSNGYVYACWISPSGLGVKVLVRIPAEAKNHKLYFKALKVYFAHPNWDDSGSDVSRLCFESYDPDIYVNESSKVWTTKEEPDLEDIGTHTPLVAVKSDSRKLSNLIAWWEKKFGMQNGQRSNNLYKLASACNDFGIPITECELALLQYEQQDFTQNEIKSIIKSAYKNQSNFGTKFFEDKPLREKIEKAIRSGKKENDLKQILPNISKEEITEIVSNLKEKIACDDFWVYDSKGNIKLSPHKFKWWLEDKKYFKFYPSKSNTFTFIYKDGNLLEETTPERIKDDTLKNLLKREDIGFRPYDYMANNAKFFHSDFLSLLDTAEINIKEDTDKSSFLYYKNCVVEVTKDFIREIDYLNIEGFIWKRQIIDRDFIATDHHDSEFRKFIWLISGANVDRYNSFKSVIGYLLHSYKTSANNRAIILNDETISENPNGGSGKGIFCTAISKMKKMSSIDGKTFEFTKSFPYQTVSADTQILVFDDVKKNFQFESLFSLITEGITLEYKGQDAIKLPVQKSPKIIITTNYTVGGIGGSFERRKFELEMSSYFNSSHTPLDEFGHLLFEYWDEKEWARFDNFMLQCSQYYLTHGLVTTEFNNLHTRKFIKETSHEFYEWSNDRENIRYNVRLYKTQLFEDFRNEYPDYRIKLTQKKFSLWLELFCKFNKFEYDLDRDQSGRYILIKNGEQMPDANDMWI